MQTSDANNTIEGKDTTTNSLAATRPKNTMPLHVLRNMQEKRCCVDIGGDQSSFDAYFPSKSNTSCSVAAHMSVPSISIFAAAMPVGAAAKQFIQ